MAEIELAGYKAGASFHKFLLWEGKQIVNTYGGKAALNFPCWRTRVACALNWFPKMSYGVGVLCMYETVLVQVDI